MKPKRQGMWTPYWTDPQTGLRLGKRATRKELAEAYRLWAIHADIRIDPSGFLASAK